MSSQPPASNAAHDFPVIAVLAPFMGGYYFGALIRGVAAAARRAGGIPLVIQTMDPGLENSQLDQAVPHLTDVGWDWADGFVVLLSSVKSPDIARLLATGKPVVSVSEDFGEAVPRVSPDNAGGIRAAVQHLVTHGHERIGFVGGGGDVDIIDRYESYVAAMRECGIEPVRAWHYQVEGEPPVAHSEAGGATAAEQMLAAGLPTTAVVCATDYNAVGLMRRLQAEGLVIPRDQAVVGFDDAEVATHSAPPLSTVVHPFEKLGERAAEYVLAALGGTDSLPATRVATRFVPRASCGCFGPAPSGVADSSPGSTLLETLRDVVRERTTPATEAACRSVTEWAQLAIADGQTDSGVDAHAAIEVLYRSLPRSDTASRILWALEQFVTQSLAAGSAQSDRVARAVAEASVTLQALAVGDEYRVSEELERVLATQYEINISLLNSARGGTASLAWVSETSAEVACLGLWETRHETPELIIAGWFDRNLAAARPRLDTAVPSAEFPPREFIERARTDVTKVLFVVPVRRDGDDRGVLAVLEQIDVRSYNARQTFNQWAALLGVALAHAEVVVRLNSQRSQLSDAVERERGLRDGMRVTEERYAVALRATNDGIWDWNLADSTVYYSERCLDLLGIFMEGRHGTIDDWFDVVEPTDLERLQSALADHVAGTGDVVEHEYRVKAPQGRFRWVLMRASVVRDSTGTPVRVIGSLSDIDGRRRVEEQLRHAALYDALTGLPNRTLFMASLSHAILRARRDPTDRYAVLFLDLDGFKIINDSLGHHVGDELLLQVGDAIRGSLRDADTGARFGGDEFAVLLESLASFDAVPRIAERLLARLAEPFTLDSQEVTISASIGIALGSNDYSSAEDVLRDADIAMYRSKATAKGHVTFFHAAMHDSAVERLRMEADIRSALAKDEITAHYQPLVSLTDHTVLGLEALVRWHHAERGWVSPDDFLAVAADCGLILPIGERVLDEVCRSIAQWEADGVLPGHAQVAVNLSHREFWDPTLAARVMKAATTHGIRSDRLAFEVTEGVVMSNPDAARLIVAELRAMGAEVAIDDFGTGSSSLSVLHELTVDVLKIDKSFVARLGPASTAGALVRAIAQMADALGMTVVAEGVETSEQAKLLLELGCARAQGYYFGRPTPTPWSDRPAN